MSVINDATIVRPGWQPGGGAVRTSCKGSKCSSCYVNVALHKVVACVGMMLMHKLCPARGNHQPHAALCCESEARSEAALRAFILLADACGLAHIAVRASQLLPPKQARWLPSTQRCRSAASSMPTGSCGRQYLRQGLHPRLLSLPDCVATRVGAPQMRCQTRVSASNIEADRGRVQGH
jgi:ferredoxin